MNTLKWLSIVALVGGIAHAEHFTPEGSCSISGPRVEAMLASGKHEFVFEKTVYKIMPDSGNKEIWAEGECWKAVKSGDLNGYAIEKADHPTWRVFISIGPNPPMTTEGLSGVVDFRVQKVGPAKEEGKEDNKGN